MAGAVPEPHLSSHLSVSFRLSAICGTGFNVRLGYGRSYHTASAATISPPKAIWLAKSILRGQHANRPGFHVPAEHASCVLADFANSCHEGYAPPRVNIGPGYFYVSLTSDDDPLPFTLRGPAEASGARLGVLHRTRPDPSSACDRAHGETIPVSDNPVAEGGRDGMKPEGAHPRRPPSQPEGTDRPRRGHRRLTGRMHRRTAHRTRADTGPDGGGADARLRGHPQQIEGPYFVDERLHWADIRRFPETWPLGRQRHGAMSLADERGVTRVHATAWPWLGRS
jgi:hypothetical protein